MLYCLKYLYLYANSEILYLQAMEISKWYIE